MSGNAGSDRLIHIDMALGPDRTEVVVVQTWRCPKCRTNAVRGKPCPSCGKTLLED
jgi:hypothetical protein